MVRDTDKEFESHKFEELIQTHKKLEELYRNYVNALEKHRNSDQADYSWSPFISEANEYRVEMYVLVAKYPELNRYEYKIDLEKQKELASKKADISHVPTSSEYVEKVQRKREVEESERIVSTANEVVEHPGVKLVAPVKLEIPSKLTIEETIDYTDDDELRKPIEIPDYLSGNVTYYYQNYMKEKLLKTELGNLKFSEYLEVVRPDLKELIEIERKREQRLDNIYKKYLKYRMALEDKTRALSFREFAQYNYGLESYEIPEGYESSKKL
jgi:hypothetical protein